MRIPKLSMIAATLTCLSFAISILGELMSSDSVISRGRGLLSRWWYISDEPVGSEESAGPKKYRSQQLCSVDPVARALIWACRDNPAIVWVSVLVLYGVAFMAYGVWISGTRAADLAFIDIFDRRELPAAIFSYLIVSPAIWLSFAWQPKRILDTLYQLESNGVICQRSGHKSLNDFIRETLVRPLGRWSWGCLPPLSFLGGLGFYLYTGVTMQGVLYENAPPRWFQTSNVYYMLWLLLIFIQVYMVAWIVVRQYAVYRCFRQLFSVLEFKPKLFHTDKRNGLAPVGDYVLWFYLPVSTAFICIFSFLVYPIFFEAEANLNAFHFVMPVIYLAVAPTILVLPLWSAHMAMVRAKNNALDKIAAQIESTFQDLTNNGNPKTYGLLEALEKTYRLVDKEYHAWPFRMLSSNESRIGTGLGIGTGLSVIAPLFSLLGPVSQVLSLYFKLMK